VEEGNQTEGTTPEEESSPGEGEAGRQPTEEEVRARLEEEVRNLRVQDILLQSVVSMINLSSRRIAKEDERDLDQARLGIDAVRALVDLLEPEPAAQVRRALDELQMGYARVAGDGEAQGPPPEGGGESGGSGEQGTGQAEPGGGESGSGERKPPPGLWTPGSG
jgi:hypothetical protein